jgi:hypothetical protein
MNRPDYNSTDEAQAQTTLEAAEAAKCSISLDFSGKDVNVRLD